MNLRDFRNLVLATARTEGAQHLQETDVAGINDLLQRLLDAYCRRTGCIEVGAVAFTPQVGVAAYELADDADDAYAPARRMASVRHVAIEGTYLFAIGTRKAGMSSEELAIAELPAYLAAENGRPMHWWPEGETRIRFNCPFDQVYTGCYFVGTGLPTLGNDGEEIGIPEHHSDAAARMCAAELLMPYAKDAGAQLKRYAVEEASEAAAAVARRQGGRSVRGSGRRNVRRL